MKIKSQVHISVDSDVLKSLYELKINPSDASEFGMLFKLAEADLIEYPKNKLSKKIIKLVNQLNETCQTKDKETQ